MINSYISIDLETTGLDPKLDKITEIGAIYVENGEVVRSFSTLVNPGRKLEKRIVELTGIRDEDLANAPYIEEVLPKLMEFMEELPLLGHGVLFDYSFLKKAAVNQKLCFEKKAVDTLRIARRYLQKLESRSLPNLCIHYGIGHHAHRALNDAQATHELYERLVREFGNCPDAEEVFRPKPLLYRVKRDTPATIAQKEQLTRLLTEQGIFLNVDVERLTRSEASRYVDRIKSGALSRSDAPE